MEVKAHVDMDKTEYGEVGPKDKASGRCVQILTEKRRSFSCGWDTFSFDRPSLLWYSCLWLREMLWSEQGNWACEEAWFSLKISWTGPANPGIARLLSDQCKDLESS